MVTRLYRDLPLTALYGNQAFVWWLPLIALFGNRALLWLITHWVHYMVTGSWCDLFLIWAFTGLKPDTRYVDMNCPSLVVFETEIPILHSQDNTKQVNSTGTPYYTNTTLSVLRLSTFSTPFPGLFRIELTDVWQIWRVKQLVWSFFLKFCLINVITLVCRHCFYLLNLTKAVCFSEVLYFGDKLYCAINPDNKIKATGNSIFFFAA